MKVLFTCMGTSDPVRGYRDGPMLHILRFYRPDKVFVFLTDESSGLERRDGRLDAVRAHMEQHWEGYAPEFQILRTDITDPSDLDAVGRQMEAQVLALLPEGREDRLLLNLSSGTPQMKQVLAMLASDARYPGTTGIQVKNPERAAGSTERTNAADYSVKDELECNEDEDTDCINRCSEPELLYHRRRQAIDQILSLLEQRDYSAVYAMKHIMPQSLKALVGHLDARDRMQDTEARERAKHVKLPFPLYPKKQVRFEARDYDLVSEVYLILLNRLHRRQYGELVLRLNPLVLHLQLRLLDQTLSQLGYRLQDILDNPRSDRPVFLPKLLQQNMPEVYGRLEKSFAAAPREGDVSIELCMRLLAALHCPDTASMETLNACFLLNRTLRNALAHQLTAVTAQQFQQASGMEPQQLMRRLGDVIAALYPECDSSLFSIYKRCGDYIKKTLV